jgi:NAD(P)H-flavin reductase
VVRELLYPQPFLIKGSWFGWLTPPPLGRSLLLVSYWVIIVIFLTNDAVIWDAYYWERIGFRAAWVSVTQVPLIYLLASKFNILGYVSGTSYDRLNWLHRWVSRTLLVTVTVHGSLFFAEWVRADFVQLELEMMPIVKYGLGAWAILVWTTLSSLAPLRRLSYEFFVLQHIAAVVVFLWLLYVHVPTYAVYNIWWSIGVLVFDRIARLACLTYQNLHQLQIATGRRSIRFGHDATLHAIPGDLTVVKLRNVSFKWTPGQHFYLWIPSIGPLECHPFTVSNIMSRAPGEAADAEFVVRAHSGFTRRLHRRASAAETVHAKAMVMGPFGCFPKWNTFETTVLISASTGASFTLPILEAVISNPCCVQRIFFLMLVKTEIEAQYYIDRLDHALHQAASSRISLQVDIVATAAYKVEAQESKDSCERDENAPDTVASESAIKYSYGRPNIAEYIHLPVEESGGETSVVICGGQELTTCVRNCVARLSDTRAVHKGTGAQGIHLHVERYCF